MMNSKLSRVSKKQVNLPIHLLRFLGEIFVEQLLRKSFFSNYLRLLIVAYLKTRQSEIGSHPFSLLTVSLTGFQSYVRKRKKKKD